MLVVALFGLRFVCHQLFPQRVALVLSTVSSATLAALLGSYYLITLIGLKSWGRVVSWGLIRSYVFQIPELLDALEISFWLTFFFAALAFAVINVLIGVLLQKYDWIPRVGARSNSRLAWTIFLIALIGTGIEAWHFLEFPQAIAGEPFSLTLNPNLGSKVLQNHYLHHEKALETREDLVRANLSPASNAKKRNVIIVVVDALRADRMTFAGNNRPVVPYLSKLEKSGILHYNSWMHSVCAESSCGLMALASSRYLHQTIQKPITLQEVLRRYGYRTHMMLSGDHTNFYGLREAYGPLDSYFDGSMAGKGFYMNDDRAVLEHLSHFPASDDTPTFIQFHLMSTHGLSKRYPEYSPFQPSRSYYADFGAPMSTTPDERYTNSYDNGVVATDAMIQKIIEMLRAKHYLENSVLIVTADHGEMLGEHGKFGHARGLDEAVLRIPFLMARFGYSSDESIPKRIVASQIDIAPTILSELNIPLPDTWSGLPLQDLAAGRKTRDFVFFQQGTEYGLLDTRLANAWWKFRVDAKDNSEFAFELLGDAAETSNQQANLAPSQRAAWIKNLIDLQSFAHDQ